MRLLCLLQRAAFSLAVAGLAACSSGTHSSNDNGPAAPTDPNNPAPAPGNQTPPPNTTTTTGTACPYKIAADTDSGALTEVTAALSSTLTSELGPDDTDGPDGTPTVTRDGVTLVPSEKAFYDLKLEYDSNTNALAYTAPTNTTKTLAFNYGSMLVSASSTVAGFEGYRIAVFSGLSHSALGTDFACALVAIKPLPKRPEILTSEVRVLGTQFCSGEGDAAKTEADFYSEYKPTDGTTYMQN